MSSARGMKSSFMIRRAGHEPVRRRMAWPHRRHGNPAAREAAHPRKAEGRCAKCGLEANPGQYDHAISLILGGKNAESNIQLLCVPCHKAKTRLDVKLKAKVARVRMRHAGIRKPSRFPGSRDSKFKKRMDGTVVLR
jgi:5-methylcytosine-specific restriction protein A